MTNGRQKLELTWIGKDDRPRLEPRILIEDPSKSYHASARRPGDHFDNMLIFGDNLLALKALESEYAGKVKCIYIDPPYNTGSAFEYYDDGIEHSLWLCLIRERLEILKRLLSAEGSIWISIDDNEMPYLRVLMDEVFGRANFLSQIVWQKRYSRENNAAIGTVHEYVVVYVRDPQLFKQSRNRLKLDERAKGSFSNPNNDPRGPWQSVSFTGSGFRQNMMYPIEAPNGRVHYPPEGRHWARTEPEYRRLREEGRFWFGQDGNGVPRIIHYLDEAEGLVPWSWWPHDDVGHTGQAKNESQVLFGKANVFPTPKPERLVQRILEISTNSGDLVLDSFAGSGTTGAVAQKMGRRWIMVELGEHCHSHIIPRLQKVIGGADKGGVTDATGWKGGGGFRYFRLAPSLLERDKYGNWVISKDYNPAMLAEAMCKHLGFTYAPSEADYWNHGHSTETDFIYVTTQKLTHDALRRISEDVGPDRTLLVCCKAFSSNTDRFDNLTVVKIPQSILKKCEWGRDDYSLAIAKLPEAADDAEEDDAPPPSKTLPLFADADDEDEEV